MVRETHKVRLLLGVTVGVGAVVGGALTVVGVRELGKEAEALAGSKVDPFGHPRWTRDHVEPQWPTEVQMVSAR